GRRSAGLGTVDKDASPWKTCQQPDRGGAAMTSTDLPATAAELRSLRKGRGAQAPDLVDRLGPRLHELAAAGGDRVATRPALVAELTSRAANLPDDLRWALLASLGLTVDTRQMTRFE